jgi:hypothetical protein
MRPRKDGDAVIGPFMKATALEAVISEMGRLAVQVGEQLNRFFPCKLGTRYAVTCRLRPAKAKLDGHLLSDRSERTVAAEVRLPSGHRDGARIFREQRHELVTSEIRGLTRSALPAGRGERIKLYVDENLP